jgi:hypothetical protein
MKYYIIIIALCNDSRDDDIPDKYRKSSDFRTMVHEIPDNEEFDLEKVRQIVQQKHPTYERVIISNYVQVTQEQAIEFYKYPDEVHNSMSKNEHDIRLDELAQKMYGKKYAGLNTFEHIKILAESIRLKKEQSLLDKKTQLAVKLINLKALENREKRKKDKE